VEEVLKQIFEKLTSIESGMQEQGKKLTAIEKTQNYHSEMFGALINAQETQKAQIDKLEIELAKLSERTDQGFTDIVEVQKSLLEMYGDHEAKIRMLRRMPV
jgi:chromosome segregation ATPase